MNRSAYLIGVGLAVVILGIGAMTRHPVTPQAKGVVLTNPSTPFGYLDWQTNGLHQPRLVEVIQGHISGAMTGVVKTDTDCAANNTGLSHCHDIILLANQKRITVIYTHNMNLVKCLAPNQTVTVKPVNLHWAKIVTNSV